MTAKAKNKGGKTMVLPVYLSEEIHKAFRHAAIDEGKSATALMHELIEEYLAKKTKRNRVK